MASEFHGEKPDVDRNNSDGDYEDRLWLKDFLREEKDLPVEAFSVALEYIQELQDYFEDQRRDLGPALQIRTSICARSKELIKQLSDGRLAEFTQELEILGRLLRILLGLNIPGRKLEELDADTGQELTETAVIMAALPAITGKTDIAGVKFPTHEDLRVTRTAWLAGLADAASELSKLTEHLVKNKIAAEEDLWQKTLYIVQEIERILHNFSRTYKILLDNTFRYEQGFSSKVRLVAMTELRITEKINNLRRHQELKNEIEKLKSLITSVLGKS